MLDAQTLDDLLYLIRCALDRRKPDPDRVLTMDLARLYAQSRRHSLAALTYAAVEAAFDGRPPRDKLPAGWREARDTAVRNALLFGAERQAVLAFCEEKGIWYLPLKGILLQEYYPGLGLREMADNDILFDAAFQQQVHDWFVTRGYEVVAYRQGAHDSYHKPPIFNFEMHTTLFEERLHPEWIAYFDEALSNLLPLPGTRWGRCFTQEDCCLYLLAHMYKHFSNGGTGLRSLVDIYLFCRAHGPELDREHLARRLNRLELTDFARDTCALAERIFGSDAPLTAADTEALAYYLTSGTYGTTEHRIGNRLQEMAGEGRAVTRATKWRYLWRRLFPDREFMERWCRREAPAFLRHRWLMPLAPWYRFGYNFARGKGRKMIWELRLLRKQSSGKPGTKTSELQGR